MTKTLRVMGKIFWLLLMVAIVIPMLYPFIYSVFGALNNRYEFGNLGSLLPIPSKLEFGNFSYAFSDTGLRPLINTVIRTAWYTSMNVVVAVLLGYVMARYEFRGKKFFFAIIICSQVIPSVMTLIPSFLMLSKIPFAGGNNWMGLGGHGLINDPLALYLPLGWGTLLWVFLFAQSMKSLPKDFEEAADIDGCGFWQIIIKIVMPMQKPIISVVAANTALNTWNDWITPFMYINKIEDSTLPAYIGMLTTQLQEMSGARDYPRVFGLACVAIIPPFLIFIFLQKYIVQGIASSGIKG
jgi:multiple sugar transport system permease protein